LLRQRSRANSVGLSDEEVVALEGNYQDPEAVHLDREMLALIRQAVSRLGKSAAEMFVLRYYEGYDNQEIAKLTNTSHIVVGVVLHRARTRLRNEIGLYLEKHDEKR